MNKHVRWETQRENDVDMFLIPTCFHLWPREILAVLRCAGMTRCRIILGRWLLWKSCNIAQKSTLGTLKEKLKYLNLCSMITSLNTKEYATVQVCAILNTPKYAYWEIQRGSVHDTHWLVLNLLGLREYKTKEVMSVVYYVSVQGGCWFSHLIAEFD